MPWRIALPLFLVVSCSTTPPKQEEEQQQGYLIINEMMIDNSWTLPDDSGEFWPWIEIHNSGPATQLQGWQLRSQNSSAPWFFPDFEIGPNEYLIVLLSGQDRSESSSVIHAGLAAGTDTRAFELLDASGMTTQTFPAAIAKQHQDVSYGYVDKNTSEPLEAYLDLPTPGEKNSDGSPNYSIRAPEFSHSRGYYDASFMLTIRARGGSDIYVSLDGSTPSKDTALRFEEPIEISTTTIVSLFTSSGVTIDRAGRESNDERSSGP